MQAPALEPTSRAIRRSGQENSRETSQRSSSKHGQRMCGEGAYERADGVRGPRGRFLAEVREENDAGLGRG